MRRDERAEYDAGDDESMERESLKNYIPEYTSRPSRDVVYTRVRGKVACTTSDSYGAIDTTEATAYHIVEAYIAARYTL